MQPQTETREGMVHRTTISHGKGNVMPVAESSILALGKWFISVILIPFLWYEHRRIDKISDKIREEHFTKQETKEQIGLRNKPIIDKLEMIHEELKEIRRGNAN